MDQQRFYGDSTDSGSEPQGHNTEVQKTRLLKSDQKPLESLLFKIVSETYKTRKKLVLSWTVKNADHVKNKLQETGLMLVLETLWLDLIRYLQVYPNLQTYSIFYESAT